MALSAWIRTDQGTGRRGEADFNTLMPGSKEKGPRRIHHAEGPSMQRVGVLTPRAFF